MLGRKAGRENVSNYRKSLDSEAVKASLHGCYSSDGVSHKKDGVCGFVLLLLSL
jgi:hypothetical protein